MQLKKSGCFHMLLQMLLQIFWTHGPSSQMRPGESLQDLLMELRCWLTCSVQLLASDETPSLAVSTTFRSAETVGVPEPCRMVLRCWMWSTKPRLVLAGSGSRWVRTNIWCWNENSLLDQSKSFFMAVHMFNYTVICGFSPEHLSAALQRREGKKRKQLGNVPFNGYKTISVLLNLPASITSSCPPASRCIKRGSSVGAGSQRTHIC